MDNKNLLESVKNSLSAGKTKDEIYKDFLLQGISVDEIQSAFNSLLEKDQKEEGSKKTILIVVTIGAILIGAGIFSFIASNWQEMSDLSKIAIILVSMVVSYGLGFYLKEKADLPKLGEALILLGSIIYGAGIFLVAQIYHIRANWPDGFVLWMLGIILLSFAYESHSLLYLAMILGFISVFSYPFSILDNFMGDPFLLTSSVLLLIATAVTFATSIVIKRKLSEDLKNIY